MAEKRMRASVTSTESTESESMMALETPPFTSFLYSLAARASTVKGKEYAHHAMLNRFMDLLNKTGRDTCNIGVCSMSILAN